MYIVCNYKNKEMLILLEIIKKLFVIKILEDSIFNLKNY